MTEFNVFFPAFFCLAIVVLFVVLGIRMMGLRDDYAPAENKNAKGYDGQFVTELRVEKVMAELEKSVAKKPTKPTKPTKQAKPKQTKPKQTKKTKRGTGTTEF